MGKWRFRGFKGRKVGFLMILRGKRGCFEGFTVINGGFWINRGVYRGNAGKGVGDVWSCSEDKNFKKRQVDNYIKKNKVTV